MKSLIKSSFLLILLMAVFNIGVTNAYAEESEAPETNKIEKVDATVLKCSTQLMLSSAIMFNTISLEGINSLASLMPECEPGTFRNGNYVLIVTSDCKIYRHKIDPHSGSEKFDKA